jgi:serine phosphatase RsbU (regulator of sigma subunit)
VGVRLLDEASTAQIRIGDVRSDLDALLRTQLAEETAMRGYVATGDRFFLEPDGPPNPRFEKQAHALEDRLRSEGLTQGAQAVADMRGAHTIWEREVAEPLLRAPHARDVDTREAYGKFLTDQMRIDGERLRAQLAQNGERVQQTLRRAIDATFAVSVLAIAVFALAALWYAMGRSQAEARLAEEHGLVDALQRALRVAGAGLPRARLGSAYASATREALVGGDLLDAWRVEDDRGWLLIADASGKGIAAARHAAFAQFALRALAADWDDPGTILERFNRLFLATFPEPEAFIVVFLGAWDARSQTLRYASAGHGTAYVRRGPIVERLSPTGVIVGLDPDQRYATQRVPLAVSDILLLATDGLSEARDPEGELFGEERIAAILAASPGDPQLLCDRLVEAANAHSHGVQDDLAIVALRVAGRHERVIERIGGPGALPTPEENGSG